MNHQQTTSPHNQSQSNSKTLLIIIFLLIGIIFLLIYLMFFKCDCQIKQQKTNSSIGSSGATRDSASIGFDDQELFSSIFRGEMEFASEIGDNKTIQFWFDWPKYRLTWSEIGEDPYLHMISADGETLHHLLVEDDSVNISYISPDMHHWLFQDPEEYVGLNEWTEDSFDVKQFVIKNLWSIDGAVQDFYLEDVTKYYLEDKLNKIVVRTTSSQPNSEDDLVTSSYTIKSIEYLDEVDQDLFEI